MGWRKRGKQTKPTTKTKKPTPESEKNDLREKCHGICLVYVKYILSLQCYLQTQTSDVNLSFPLSICVISYPRGCHP